MTFYPGIFINPKVNYQTKILVRKQGISITAEVNNECICGQSLPKIVVICMMKANYSSRTFFIKYLMRLLI